MGLKQSVIHEIPVNKIKANRFGLREINEDMVREVSNSVRSQGLLQPIMVRRLNGEFEVVFGLHRLEACKRLGWEKIPAIVVEISEEEAFLTCVVENLQRNIKINPVTEARGYELLISKGYTPHEIAQKIGKSDSYVYERLRILKKLHPAIRKRITHVCNLTPSHAERLALIPDPKLQLKLAKLIEKRQLSVRQLERLTRKIQTVMPKGCLCRQCPNYPCKYIPEVEEAPDYLALFSC